MIGYERDFYRDISTIAREVKAIRELLEHKKEVPIGPLRHIETPGWGINKLNSPKALTFEEYQEIWELECYKGIGWGHTKNDRYNNEEFDRWVSSIYACKFYFVSGCPGYVGDLYVIFGNALVSPIILTRNDDSNRIKGDLTVLYDGGE